MTVTVGRDAQGASPGDFAPLAERHDDEVAMSQWTFAGRHAVEANLHGLRHGSTEAAQPSGLTVVSFLAGSARPVDAGILRGTTASERGEDVHHGLHYVRWTNGAGPPDAMWTPAGGTRRAGPSRFSRYEGYNNAELDPSDARLAVLVEIHFAGPDEERLRRWADLVLAALNSEPRPVPGLISAQFHVSDDGTQVANLAIWTSEPDYDRVLSSGPPGIAQTDTPEWRAVITFPGIERNTVSRYTEIATWRR